MGDVVSSCCLQILVFLIFEWAIVGNVKFGETSLLGFFSGKESQRKWKFFSSEFGKVSNVEGEGYLKRRKS